MKKINYTRLTLISLVFTVATSCTALHTSVKNKDLEVQTQMSETIFLEPVSPEKRTLYVSVRNTSSIDLNIKAPTIRKLEDSGYRVVNNPDTAHFMIQANVLKVTRVDRNGNETVIDGAVSGGVLGGAVSNQSDRAKGAVIGAVAGIIGNALVDDNIYTLVTDLQVRERSNTTKEWTKHEARVVSTASQVNLEIDSAIPGLEKGLVNALAGVFAD